MDRKPKLYNLIKGICGVCIKLNWIWWKGEVRYRQGEKAWVRIFANMLIKKGVNIKWLTIRKRIEED